MARIEAVFPCHLQLVHSEVRLVSAMDGKILGLWPFKCIRRYKFVGNLFSIEAGRKAPTGEGIFEFISNECSEIYRVMDTIIRTKAGSTTMNRIASERLHNQVEQGHQPVKKVNSVPILPKQESRYEYARPIQTTIARTPPPPVPLPIPPELPLAKSDPTYDILSPGIDSEVDGKFTKHGGTPSDDSEYNTLKFANAQPRDGRSPVPQRAPKLAGSPGSYDTLVFDEDTSNRDETLRAQGKDGQYDTLQFGENRDTSLMSDVQGTKNRLNDNDLAHSSGSFYNTLDHSSGSVGSISSNTYDTLDTGNKIQSGDTYDTVDKPQPPTTLDLASNTYDALQHENQKPTGKDSPGKPIKPPPRRKPPSIPQQPEMPTRKISAGVKPEKPVRPVRKNVPAKEVMDDQKRPKAESISDVIQKRLAHPQPPVDDGSYASVDHEYTSIDYTKVSKSDNDSSDIYTEPNQDNTKATPIPKPVQKPARGNPKPIKNLFKKAPPKPKAEGDGGNFANELKKKLDIKKKKKEHKPAPTNQTSHQTGQSGIDDDIYDEIDHSRGTHYSEPDTYSEPGRYYSEPDRHYSEPDPYSEPAV